MRCGCSMISRAETATTCREQSNSSKGMSPMGGLSSGRFEGVEGCFHLAAIASVVRSHREWLRTHEVNLGGTINIFEQARLLRSRRKIPIVYASTAAIYGDCGHCPGRRAAPARTAQCIWRRQTRLRASRASRRRSAWDTDNRVAVLQPLWAAAGSAVTIFGGDYDFRRPAANGEPVEIFGDGEQIRDFTYVGDAVCRALPRVAGCEHQRSGVQHLHRQGDDSAGTC